MSRNRSTVRPLSLPHRSRGAIVLACSGWVVLAATALPAGSILRAALAVAFVSACPGAALGRFWPERDLLERCVLAVAISTALAMLVAEGLILADFWSARLAVSVLATITTTASLLPSSVGFAQ
jgi:uncharacterized membrane protein